MDLDKALSDPAAEFATPDDVVKDKRLTPDQKRAILEQWQQDARLLEKAAAEKMAGGEPNLLHQVSEAIIRLDEQAE